MLPKPSSKKSLTLAVLFFASVTVACEPAGVEQLTGAWEFRKGFASETVGRSNHDDWQTVELPSRLHLDSRLLGHEGWITLRRPLSPELSRLLRSNQRVSFFSGNVGDVARFSEWFLSGNAAADYTSDGVFALDDIVAFIETFQAGC